MHFVNPKITETVPMNIKKQYQSMSVEAVKDIYKHNMDLMVSNILNGPYTTKLLLPNMKSHGNIGNIIRSCATFGCIQDIIICGQRHIDTRSCVGANHYVNLEFIQARHDQWPTKKNPNHIIQFDWDVIFNYLKEQSETNLVVFLEQNPKSVKLYDMKRTMRDKLSNNSKLTGVLFMVGHEEYGIPKYFMNDIHNSMVVEIPPYNTGGVIPSLNVANAFSIMMYEFIRCV